MKRIAMATLLMGALGMLVPAQQAAAQVNVSVSIGGFYDELSPYGEWVDCDYGDCWVPRGVGEGWQPYTNGEWIYTRYGWTWVSGDPWGGDPYHYGTWAFIGRHGWVWVPGTVWAPAWVTWSYSDSYVGWAPMPPTVAFGQTGYSGRPVIVSETQYVFVPTNRFVGTNVSSVRMEARRNAELFRQSKPMTRFDVSGGVVRNMALPLATVQRATKSKIETREITIAKTTPRPFSPGVAGKAGHVGIVAPANEMKAVRASRQGAAPHAAAPEPQGQQQGKPQQQARQQEQAKQQLDRQQGQAKQQLAKQPDQAKQQEQPKEQQARQQGQAKQQEQAKEQQARQQGQARQQQQQKAQPQQQPPPATDPRAHAEQAPAVHPAQPQQDRQKAQPAGQEKEKKDQPSGEARPK